MSLCWQPWRPSWGPSNAYKGPGRRIVPFLEYWFFFTFLVYAYLKCIYITVYCSNKLNFVVKHDGVKGYFERIRIIRSDGFFLREQNNLFWLHSKTYLTLQKNTIIVLVIIILYKNIVNGFHVSSSEKKKIVCFLCTK